MKSKLAIVALPGKYFGNIMSAKEDRTWGDSQESTGNLAPEQDNQEREGICESANSGVAGSSGMQPSSSHHASVQGQEPERVNGTISSRLHSNTMTFSLHSREGTEAEKGEAQEATGGKEPVV